jgi:SAM-dependent methyltransferase
MTARYPTDHLDVAATAAFGRPRTLLDVGCGSGVNGMTGRARGARVTGIEFDAVLAGRARGVLDEVLEIDPEATEAVAHALGDRRFDVVLLGGALERSPRPHDLCERFARYVAPEGRFIISVRNREAWPVRMGLTRPDLGYPPAAESHRYFTRGEALDLVRHTGLEVLQVDHNPMLLKATRSLFDVTAKRDESSATGFRDIDPYRWYVSFVRPLETAIAGAAPGLLAYQTVVVGRRRVPSGPVSLTVGMLTMDEEPSIARMIEAIRAHAPDALLLCVDSSVKDRTPAIAESLGARVLRQLPPRGHGPAMELLMYEAAAQSDALIYLDCDFTYPPDAIPALRRILESGVDVVNAARTRRRPQAMPAANFAANRAFAWTARALNGMPVSDLHSGMRAYRSSVIRGFSFDGEGDAIPIDTLLWPARCGYRVVEVPIDYQERVGFSKLRKLSGTVWTFIRLGRTLGIGSRRSDAYEAWDTLDG